MLADVFCNKICHLYSKLKIKSLGDQRKKIPNAVFRENSVLISLATWTILCTSPVQTSDKSTLLNFFFYICRSPSQKRHADDDNDNEWSASGDTQTESDSDSQMKKQQARAKRSRSEMPPETLSRDRELARLRMQRYRARKALQSPPPPPPTASQKRKLRAKWREQKRKQRESMTPEEKKVKHLHNLQRQIDKLTSEEFEVVMTSLTPRKRKCISSNERDEQSVIDSLRAAASPLKKSREWNSKRKLQFLVQASGPKNVLNLRRETFRKYRAHDASTDYTRKERKDKLSKEVVDEVQNFFKDHSRPLPIARQAGKSLLSDPIRNIHSQWNIDGSTPMSQSMFYKLRPVKVLTVDKTKFVGCQCEYCLNADYMVSNV